MAPRSSSDRAPLRVLERLAVVTLGLYLTAVGFHALSGGDILYRNYLRSPVAAPVAVAIGITLMIAGFFGRH